MSKTRTSAPSTHAWTTATGPTRAEFGLLRARWIGRRLELAGYGRYTDRAEAHPGGTRVWLTLHHRASSRRVSLRGTPQRLGDNPDETPQPRHCHDRSGFTALIDPIRLATDGQWLQGDWELQASLFAGLRGALPGRLRGQGAAAHLGPGPNGAETWLPARWIDRDVRLQPGFLKGRLQLTLEQVHARLTVAHQADDGIHLSGFAPSCPEGTVMRLRHCQSSTVTMLPVRFVRSWKTTFAARLPYQAFTAGGAAERGGVGPEYWETELLRPDGSVEPLTLDERGGPVAGGYPLPGSATRALHLTHLGDGRLRICLQPAAAHEFPTCRAQASHHVPLHP
ncbi:hypothetical protein ACFVH7_12555 [Kitasatospora indigofera]|uniref:hypothetical protein n=1 Tax=Kitasatospora indigofera TaxID=67307 RepID=UPI003642E51C